MPHTAIAAPSVIEVTEMLIFVTERTTHGTSREDMAARLNETDAVLLNIEVHCVPQQECEFDVYQVHK